MPETRTDPQDPPRGSSVAVIPLLDRIRDQSLDEDYEMVAARRRAAGQEGQARRRTGAWPAVTVLVGVILAVAVTQTSEIATVNESSRPVLIDRIETRREALAETQGEVAAVRAAIREEGETQATLTADLEEATASLERLRARTGFAAVRGPGVRVTVADPANVGDSDLVRDTDLALLVNGLWSAGAEAIAINGQRMTALTYIQNSGPVIRVNSQPLSSPYVVEAIGDPRTLPASLLETQSGARFFDFARLLGFQVDRQNVDVLSLPAARSRSLRFAREGSAGDQSKPIEEGGPM